MRRTLLAALLLAASASARAAEPVPGVGERYLTVDGKPVFLMGVNYVHSKNWLTTLEHWDPATTAADFAALRSLGVSTVRWFPLWPLVQPRPDAVDDTKLARVDELVTLAGRSGLRVQLAAITGWMSGYTFLPPWADGEVFADPRIVAGQQLLVRSLASRFRGRPELQGYDFGNELNVLVDFMKLKATPADVERWMQGTYRAFKEADPTHPVTNGIGTGFTEHFNAPAVARASDYMSVHSYPYFHRTNKLDPPIGQRTTYSVNYMIAWAAMEGRPVLVQETGANEDRWTSEDIRRYLRVTALSSWGEGASGYFWWNSHTIDRAFRVPKQGVYLNYSIPGSTGDLGPSESSMGLLDGANRPRAAGREFAQCARSIEQLGVGWKDERPAVYVVVPPGGAFMPTMIDLVTPFVLLKQAHARPKLMRDGDAVPADAAAVVVPGFALSAAGRAQVGRFLEAGGVVYQSWEKDFGDAIRLTGRETASAPTKAWVTGRLGSLGGEQELRVPDMPVRDVELGAGADDLALVVTGKEDPLEWSFGRPLYAVAPVGKGRYYYFAGRLEAGLARQYDPWARDQSNHVYAAFLPPTAVDLDEKRVELLHKTRGGEEIVGLISHSAEPASVTLRLREPARLVDFFDGQPAGSGDSVELRLAAGDVRVLRVVHP